MIKYTKEQLQDVKKLVRVDVENGFKTEEIEVEIVKEIPRIGLTLICKCSPGQFPGVHIGEIGNILTHRDKEYFNCLPEDVDFMINTYKKNKIQRNLELIKQKEAELEQLKNEIAQMSKA